MATITQRLEDIIVPIVTDLGLELFDLEFAGATVRVTIDKAPADGVPGVIDLGDITAVTRAVSRALDEHDPIVDRYSLEVSSPGLERPLRTPLHFERAIGQIVSIKTVAVRGASPSVERRLKGTLVRAGAVGAPLAQPDEGDPDAGVPEASTSIDVVLDDGRVRTVVYDDIDKARTVFEWGPEPRSSKPKTKPAGKPTRTGAANADAERVPTATQPKKPKNKKVKSS